MLAMNDPALAARVQAFRDSQRDGVLANELSLDMHDRAG